MWLDTLDENGGCSLLRNVERSNAAVTQDKVTSSMELLLAKMDKLNASLGRRVQMSSERLHQVIRLLESCEIPGIPTTSLS